MRILQMHRSLGAGGIEAMVFHLSNAFVKGNDVTVCTINQPSESDHFYINLDSSIKKETIGKTEKSNPISIIFRIYRYIKGKDVDVIQLHGFFYFYSLAILLLHRKKHFFYTVHSDAKKENNPWDLRLLPLKRYFFKKRWILPITISPVSQESFKELYNCDSKMIFNGIATPILKHEYDIKKEFHFSHTTKVFIHAGRLSLEKNQVMLCRIFDYLIKGGKDIALIIAGPVHFRSIYDQMESFFSDRIKYIGERSDIPELMSQCSGMCLCSEYEGLPVVLLEALAVGCVPICTPVGGIVNVIENAGNGILSTDVSEESYRRALESYLNDSSDHVSAMRDNCIKSFESFDIKKTACKYLEYYSSVIKK